MEAVLEAVEDMESAAMQRNVVGATGTSTSPLWRPAAMKPLWRSAAIYKVLRIDI